MAWTASVPIAQELLAWTASVPIRPAASCASTSSGKGPQCVFSVLPQWPLPSMPVNSIPKLIVELAASVKAERRAIGVSPSAECCLTHIEARKVTPRQVAWQQYHIVKVCAALPGGRTFPSMGSVGTVVLRKADLTVRVRFQDGMADLFVCDLACLQRVETPYEWCVVDVAPSTTSTRVVVYARKTGASSSEACTEFPIGLVSKALEPHPVVASTPPVSLASRSPNDDQLRLSPPVQVMSSRRRVGLARLLPMPKGMPIRPPIRMRPFTPT